MRTFLKWAGFVAGAAAVVVAYGAIADARKRLKRGLARAETVADRTRAALEETEAALHDARTAV